MKITPEFVFAVIGAWCAASAVLLGAWIFIPQAARDAAVRALSRGTARRRR
jgi:hypothetical protein